VSISQFFNLEDFLLVEILFLVVLYQRFSTIFCAYTISGLFHSCSGAIYIMNASKTLSYLQLYSVILPSVSVLCMSSHIIVVSFV
jgi:hypothetical protein